MTTKDKIKKNIKGGQYKWEPKILYDKEEYKWKRTKDIR